MARTKNMKRSAPLGSRYPQAVYRIVETSDLSNETISNLHEIIQQLLNELIDRVVSIITNTEIVKSRRCDGN